MPAIDPQNAAPARAQPQVAPSERHGGDFTPEPVSRAQTHPAHGGSFTPDPPSKSQTFPKHGGDFTPGSPSAEEGSPITTISLPTQASHLSQTRALPSASSPPSLQGLSFPPSSSYASSSRTPSVSASSITVVGSPRTPAASFGNPAIGQELHDIPLGPVGYPKPPPSPQDGSRHVLTHHTASRSVRSVAESSRTAVSATHSTAPFASQAVSLPQADTYKVIPNDGTRQERDVPTHLLGTLNCCCAALPCRGKRPHHYLNPTWEYVPASAAGTKMLYWHRDHARRETAHPMTDRYLHSADGKLRTLMVACTDDIWQAAMAKKNQTTWRRTYVRKMAPYRIRLASWVIDYTKERNCGSYLIELLGSLCFMTAMMLVPFSGIRFPAAWRHGGDFAPILFKYYGDAKVWNNPLEQSRGRSLPSSNHAYRTLKPRHLCFLREPERGDCVGVDVKAVVDWENAEAKAGRATTLSYLFVAYSTEHFSHSNASDLRALHAIAETAARDAGIPAYWVACSCMRNPEELESDVYRIADVLRGAQGMIIAVGAPNGGPTRPSDVNKLLAQWGQRMWTFPEVLLSPGDQIAVHMRSDQAKKPFWISKSQFAAHVWGDAHEARQLTDHYSGTLVLSRLELAVLALRCLYRRDTTQYLAGDQAYALMGLLRMRPEVDKTDTPFQAFSRLSIVNDSDSLLERYLCMVPPSGDTAAWHYMEDAYGCSAWDVAPYVQVAGVCDNDSVVLDGAYGASIRWKSFHPVGFTRLFSWRRFFSAFLLQFNGWILVAGALMLDSIVKPLIQMAGYSSRYGYGSDYSSWSYVSAYLFYNPVTLFFAIIFLLLSIVTFFCMPMLIRSVMGGQFRSVEAALFGVEGYMSPATAERAIFGCAYGRMGWSTNGSPLSRSYLNEKHERVGVDPLRDPTVQEKVNLAKVAMPGSKRIFTLINTYTMEVTLFEAVRPPTCLFLCAVEGGMQRAIGCSYDYTTQTFYRETVVRMDTTVLDRMGRVPRFRIGIRKPEVSVRPC